MSGRHGDDCSGDKSGVSLSTITRILTSFPHFRFVVFSTYFVRTIRITCRLHRITHCIVTSPTRVPGPKTPCRHVIGPLFEVPISTRNIVRRCCDTCGRGMVDICNSNSRHCNISLSIVSYSCLSSLTTVATRVIVGCIPRHRDVSVRDVRHCCPVSDEVHPRFCSVGNCVLQLVTRSTSCLH